MVLVRIYRFLRINTTAIAIATMMATVAAAMYVSVGGSDNVVSKAEDEVEAGQKRLEQCP